MKYQVTLFSGESILLTDDQYVRMLAAWDAGAEEFSLGNQRISRKGVASLGYTTGAIQEMKSEETANYQALSYEEQKKLKEQRYEIAKAIAATRKQEMIASGKANEDKHYRKWKTLSGKELKVLIDEPERENHGMTQDEEISGAPMYYLNEFGEKMYS